VLNSTLTYERRGKLYNKKLYDHVPESDKTSYEGKVTILRNQQVQTNRTIQNDKPNIIICDDKQQTFMLINLSIPGDIHVIKKEAEKILKYKDLIIDIHCMWNVKVNVMPVIKGATGTISKSLGQYQSKIPGKREIIKNLQKTAVLSTAHILRQVLT
jgi:3-deoxy-D-manno-octulosonic acid (KDO) 8-phosphate synthase